MPRVHDDDMIGIETIAELGGVYRDGEARFPTDCGDLVLTPSGYMTWLAGPMDVTTVRELRTLLRVYGFTPTPPPEPPRG